MAQPIPMQLPSRDPREELYSRLEKAPKEHAEAVLAAYEVLQGLHDRGVLELLRGVFGSGDTALQTLVAATKKPETIRAIRNLVILAKLLGTIEPESLAPLANSFPEAMAKTERAEPPGVGGLLARFRRKDVRRGVLFINNLLEALGRSLASEEHL